jgi:hypothetical protein
MSIISLNPKISAAKFQSIIISFLREHTSERVPKFLTTSSSRNNLIVSSK